jgi:hypothetical protein
MKASKLLTVLNCTLYWVAQSPVRYLILSSFCPSEFGWRGYFLCLGRLDSNRRRSRALEGDVYLDSFMFNHTTG